MNIKCACGCGNEFQLLDKYGRARKFIWGHVGKKMAQTNRLGSEFPCGVCKKIVYRAKAIIGKNKGNGFFCSRGCGAKYKRTLCMEKNPTWKGGRYLSSQGYWLVYNPGHKNFCGKYILEHRLILSEKLGRSLGRNEIAHHINGNKIDNRHDNIQLMTRSQHVKHHGLRNRFYKRLHPENSTIYPR